MWVLISYYAFLDAFVQKHAERFPEDTAKITAFKNIIGSWLFHYVWYNMWVDEIKKYRS